MSDKIFLTKKRFLELQEEYNTLISTGRKEMADRIAEARSHGDLSENADYDAAKEAQGMLELKINNLSSILMRSQVLNSADLPNDKVYILSIVTLKDQSENTKIYELVSEVESDSDKGKISVTSPLGKLMLGKKVGDTLEIKGPKGIAKYEILNIKRSD